MYHGKYQKRYKHDVESVERQRNAAFLLQQRAKRSPQEQIAMLDDRLGVGVGAVKERARLAKQIEKSKN